jgi:hypothetical protein
MEDTDVKVKILKLILKKQDASLNSGFFFVVGRVQRRNILSRVMNLDF